MASIGNDPNGRKRILFKAADGRRRTIRLGKVPLKLAESITRRVEALNAAQIAGQQPDEETARWLRTRDGELRDKLVAVGLAEPRERLALDQLLDQYRATRRDVTDSTKTVWRQTCRNLVAFLGSDRQLRDITPADADEFRIYLEVDQGLAETTVGKRIQFARQFFRHAIRRRLIEENPFADVEGSNKSNPAKRRFITRETIQRVLDYCPNAEWRLLVALSRYGALRCPSEHLALKRGHIDWARQRITVPSQKTQRYEGKAERVIPLFPELVQPLLDVLEQAEPGTEYLITKYRGPNLRTGLLRILKRAGVEPWPRLFHNLRASRQTELEEQFPSHVVCHWCGNSEQIARKHYLTTHDEHYAQAAQNPAQQRTATGGNVPHCVPLATENPGEIAVFPGFLHVPVEDKGVEPSTS